MRAATADAFSRSSDVMSRRRTVSTVPSDSHGPLRVPPRLRRGARRGDEDAELASAVWLIDHMCGHLGIDDLGDSEVLDFGCGVKFTQALINRQLPIKRYVGIDVQPEMINYLQRHVGDPRFEYHHLDARNVLYNPGGVQLSDTMPLPIDGQTFDVICLFSVFTHLAPHDYRTMLKLLRRFAKSDGRLFFTLYVGERTPGGHGLMDSWSKILGRVRHEDLERHLEKHPETAEPITTFRDLDPTRPLNWAVYSEGYARELVDGTGWYALSLSPPDEYIQHHFLCAPQ
jgi:SAM-dependent methyltransferase